MTVTTKSSTPTVPPARLGLLLTQRRHQLGLSLEELAEISEGELTVDELKLAEQGHHSLDDDFVTRITKLYECNSGSVIPVRYRLIVDIDRGEIITGSSSTTLPKTEPTEILERYLAFVYLMRGQIPGTKLNLRGEDLEVLAEALEASSEQIERRLIIMMGSKQVKQRTYSLRKRIAVSAVGLLVGFTSMGALILTPDTSPASAETPITQEATTSVVERSMGKTGSGPQIEMPSTSSTEVTLEKTAPNSSAETSTTAPGGGNPQKADEVAPAGPETVEEPDLAAAESTSITQEAEALISYDWQTHLPGWTVEYDESRSGYRGMTNRSMKKITIYVRDDDSRESIADVLAHELGHALDLEHLNDNDRIQWLNSRNLPHVWWVSDGHTDFSVGQGDFAEAVAAIMVGSPSDSAHGGFTDDQLELAASLLPA